jgi:hypothetical protein
VAVLLALTLTLAPSSAQAAPAEGDVRVARRLFADAEKDEDAARWADALDKLRRVARVKLTAGIHYHIALCEEHLGQLATALDEYTSAEGQARAENAQDVLAIVGKRIADLGPRVPRLTLRLVPDVPDAAVALDGTNLPAAVLGTALPVDPGEHRIEVTAPDRPSTTQNVTLRERDMTVLDVRLADVRVVQAVPPPASSAAIAPSPPLVPGSPAALPAEPLAAARGPSRTGAAVATVGTVVLAGGGIAAFLLAGSAHTTAVAECREVPSLAPGACESQKNSVRAWDFTAAGAWLGAAGVGTVAVIAWAHPGSQRASSGASAQMVVGLASLGLAGRF